MTPFLIGLVALLITNIATDHAAQRECFDELKGGARLGS